MGPVTGPAADGASPWLHRTTVLAFALLYLAVLLPALSRSAPSDDTLLVVPALLADLDGGSLGHALTRLLAPDPPYLPRAVWKLYVLASLWLFGPTHAGLVYVGLALHAMASALVFTLATRLGLSRRVAWLAGSLHLTAYAGFHAYVWPVGVQHALTILGVLLLVTLYLATDRRWRAGLPSRGYYWATVLAALLSSLSRASSLIGPVAVLAHALLGPGDAVWLSTWSGARPPHPLRRPRAPRPAGSRSGRCPWRRWRPSSGRTRSSPPTRSSWPLSTRSSRPPRG